MTNSMTAPSLGHTGRMRPTVNNLTMSTRKPSGSGQPPVCPTDISPWNALGDGYRMARPARRAARRPSNR
jgi:hypothetical protein